MVCFLKASNQRLPSGFRVFQQAAPPNSNLIDSTYNFWPATDAATESNLNNSTCTDVNSWAFVWAYRSNHVGANNRRSNPIPGNAVIHPVTGLDCRANFSSHAKANAATRSSILHILGKSEAEYQAPWIAAGGVAGDFISYDEVHNNPEAYFDTVYSYNGEDFSVTVDKVPLINFTIVEGSNAAFRKGIFLDYECQDSRAEAVTTAFVQQVAIDVHSVVGKEILFYTNPLNTAVAPFNGLGASNIPTIMDAVDMITVLLWSGNPEGSIKQSFENQVALFGSMTPAKWAKVAINFELGDSPGTTLLDADYVYSVLHNPATPTFNKLIFWRNLTVAGGPCTDFYSQRVARAVFGPRSTVFGSVHDDQMIFYPGAGSISDNRYAEQKAAYAGADPTAPLSLNDYLVSNLVTKNLVQ